MDFNALKRLAVLVVGIGAIAGNKKLGLDLDGAAQAAIVTMVLGFITQSALKEAHANGLEAAAKVVTVADAKAELSK